MLVLSSTCTSSPPLMEQLHLKQHDRVSSSLSSSTSSSCNNNTTTFSAVVFRRRISVKSSGRSLPVLCCSSKLKVMAETAPKLDAMADDDTVPDNQEDVEFIHHRAVLPNSLADVPAGQELLSRIKKESENGRLPVHVVSALEELYLSYTNAVLSSEVPQADEIALSNMSAMFDCVLRDEQDPFIFQPHHKAVRGPFDYYAFGQNYIRPLVDFGSSYVGNLPLFHEIEEKLNQGHNVILMSNHQTEADPAVIALLLEGTNSHIAENLIYVAGDRVVTDRLCKPFSMGRNLLCVYSKKHMHDEPELVEMKKRANTRSLKEMALLLRGGSQIIWIAPSGGRDRPDPTTNEWFPAPFDTSAVDNMRRLVDFAGVPGHIYPLALLCYDIMPPPPQVEKEIGEKRVMAFHGTGLSVGPEINYHDITLRCGNEAEIKTAYAQALYGSVSEQYKVLNAAVHGKLGFGAATPAVPLSQPWLSC